MNSLSSKDELVEEINVLIRERNQARDHVERLLAVCKKYEALADRSNPDISRACGATIAPDRPDCLAALKCESCIEYP